MKYDITIDALLISDEMAAFLGVETGNILVSFPGGHQMVLPADVIAGIVQAQPPAVERKPQALNTAPRPPADIPPDYDPDKDTKVRVCVECGVSTDKIMPSGKCFSCAKVKCPTCGAPAARADMMGQYCPSCLPRNKG
jgi:hypothetical protein